MTVYHKSIEKLICYKENKIDATETVNHDFLRPLVEGVKVIQYGNEAIVEIGGQQLWFVHSMELSSITKLENPVEVKELSICFKTNMDKIPSDLTMDDQEVILFSYFCHPVQQKIKIEVEVMKLLFLYLRFQIQYTV
jgi:hypothetical protein